MKAISQLVVHIMDLVEAEGGALRAHVRQEGRRACDAIAALAMSGAMLIIAIPLCLAGFGLLLTGFMWWLEMKVGRPFAACITGLLFLIASSVFLLVARAIAGRSKA